MPITTNDIDGSLQRVRTFISNFNESTKTYRDDLKTKFKDYLNKIDPENKMIGDENSNEIDPVAFREIDAKYNKLIKALRKCAHAVAVDYNNLLTVASDINYYIKQKETIDKEIASMQSSKNSLEKYKKLKQLKSKHMKLIMEYGKLVAQYNQQINKFEQLKNYLGQGMIVYSPLNSSGKNYSILIKEFIDQLNEFIVTQGVSELREKVIMKIVQKHAANVTSLSTGDQLLSLNLIDSDIPGSRNKLLKRSNTEQFDHPEPTLKKAA